MKRFPWLATTLLFCGPAFGTAQGSGASPMAGRSPLTAGATVEPVIVRGQPRTYQVISVPLPDTFRTRASIGYTVEAEAGFNVIGRRSGTLDPREHNSALVTIGLPASAEAGRVDAAAVVFVSSSDTVVVPVIVDVTPVRRIVLGARSRIDDLQPGERFDITFTVTNLGNAHDTVSVALTTPEDWRVSRTMFEPVVIAAGKSHGFTTRLNVPNNSGTGGFFVRVRATGVDTTGVQERTITLTVGERIVENTPPGPVLRTGFGTVSVDGASPEGIVQASVSGTVAADVSVDARIATTPNLGSNAVRGLNRVGAFIGEPRLTLWAPTWRFEAGSSVTRFTDLTGVNAGASGVAFAFDGAEYEAGLLLGRPLYTDNFDRGHLFGVRGGTNIGPARVSAAISSLDARAASQQKLTAVGVEGEMDALGLGTFGTELAWREYEQGNGLGWRVSFLRQNDRGHVNARVVHAPGGSAAFAQAVDEVTLSADRSFGRFHMSASLLSASDDNPAFDAMTSHAWAITPQYQLTGNTAVRLSARGAAYDVRGATAFGNREAGVVAGVTSQRNQLFYSVELGVERFTRSITLDDQSFKASAPRYSWRGGASYLMPYGVLQLETSWDKTSDETVSPNQLLIMMRADRMRFEFLPSSMYLNAEVAHQRWSGERSFVTTRLGAGYTTPFGFDVSASIERNPLASGLFGRTPIVFALRVDRMIQLPRLPYGSYRGRVFQDLNANGAWDVDEPGAAHVTVKRNGVRAVTDRNGVFTFWESRAPAPVEVETATLPHGWILAGPPAVTRDIPLTSTSSVVVTLELGTPERARGVDVSQAIVVARDAAGREWIARRNGAETAIFDALPAGSYTLDFNFATSGEPLRPDRAYTVDVHGNGSQNVTVRVQGRPLRFRTSGG